MKFLSIFLGFQKSFKVFENIIPLSFKVLKLIKRNYVSLYQVPDNFLQNGKINKSVVSQEFEFPIFNVPSLHFKKVHPIFSRFSPNLRKFENVLIYHSNENQKGIILDPDNFKNIYNKLTNQEIKFLKEIDCELIDSRITFSKFTVSYNNYFLQTLLEWAFGKNIELSSHSFVGHMVHLNLREKHLPYKNLIGELILDYYHPRIKTVVGKVNKVDSEFRNAELELLAGEPDYVTTVKENKFQFNLDYSKVYWNPRLSTEHLRVVNVLKSGDIVYDACAGVGPFAIPAAKKRCHVIANDLNGDCCHWFRTNVELNSTRKHPISIDMHNMDAKDFIEKVVIPDITETVNKNKEITSFHLIINHPSKAVEFLPAIVANNNLDKIIRSNVILNVKCYCFIGREITQQVVRNEIISHFGNRLKNLNFRFVRNVSPPKDFYCAEISVNLSSINDI